ncbi:MAG: methionine--tRNA ligase [Candidatus Latescibacterota bacterium]
MERIYVTTSIPYVNARPHVGFALELVQADAIARHARLVGRPTRFQSGTDENAGKNAQVARALGIAPHALVDAHSAEYRRLVDALGCAADDFVRTTEERHCRGVQALWRRLRPEDLYRRAYRGRYCSGCEDFLGETDLVDGRCPDHDAPLAEVEEENWFFRLSAYQEPLLGLLEEGRLRVVPEKRRAEVLAFVRRGLRDISVSRRAERMGHWGIPVPGHPDEVIYVWIDALANYITGPGFGGAQAWQEWWGPGVRKVHVIGKNVWKFHAVYWPALLLSAGLPPPDEVVVHGFLTAEGRKIGKSLGNAVDPFPCVQQVGADGLRYYLLRAVPPFDDGDFALEQLRRVYHADLANGLGNLVSRVTALAARSGLGGLLTGPQDAALPRPPAGYGEAMAEYAFQRALESLWAVIGQVDRQIEEVRPWEALRAGQEERLRPYLTQWLGQLRVIGHWLQPFLPATGAAILRAVGADPVQHSPPLFPRLERPAANAQPTAPKEEAWQIERT